MCFYATTELKRAYKRLAVAEDTTLQELLERAAQEFMEAKTGERPPWWPESGREKKDVEKLLAMLRAKEDKDTADFSRILRGLILIWDARHKLKNDLR